MTPIVVNIAVWPPWGHMAHFENPCFISAPTRIPFILISVIIYLINITLYLCINIIICKYSKISRYYSYSYTEGIEIMSYNLLYTNQVFHSSLELQIIAVPLEFVPTVLIHVPIGNSIIHFNSVPKCHV